MPRRNLNDPRMLLKARSVLLAAYDLLSDPRKWTQGATAKDKLDRNVPPIASSAEKWCATGAIQRSSCLMVFAPSEAGRVQSLAIELMQRDLRRATGHESIPAINDGSDGYQRIMAAFRRLLDRDQVQALSRRSEAAMKGWMTRRMIRARFDTPPPTEPTMTFGGTLPTTDTSPERKEITV
jgi:hypothetical protein